MYGITTVPTLVESARKHFVVSRLEEPTTKGPNPPATAPPTTTLVSEIRVVDAPRPRMPVRRGWAMTSATVTDSTSVSPTVIGPVTRKSRRALLHIQGMRTPPKPLQLP